MSDWIDVSVPLGPDTVRWPNDPRLIVGRFLSMAAGDPCNVSAVSMCVHAGTHVDAPVHYVDRGIDVAHLPFSYFAGPARVIGIRGVNRIDADELRRHCPERGERLLLKTDNSSTPWWNQPFMDEFCGLTVDAARFLVETGVRTIGLDYLSVAPVSGDGETIHRVLLTGGVAIVEGLNLVDVPWGRYEMMCLPLRLEGCDGSPVRAVLRPI